MKVAPITSPLPGEHLATTAPTMAPETPIDWRQRLNFWAGRALTADALELEQENRAAELARRGRVVTAGVVRGFDVALEAPAAPPDPLVTAGHFIHLLPGYGITISGEDVIVPRPLRIALDQIPIHYVRYLDAGEPAPADVSGTTPMELGGVKVETDDFASGYVPWAAVLIAQPAELGLFGNVDPTDPCELDLSADAFSDERRVDAMFLRFFQIPLDWKNDPLLTDPNDPRWRNRLAQIIFREESKGAARQYLRFRASQPAGEQWDTVLASRDVFPWEFFGVPLALLSSEVTPAGARAFYLDRASVARPAGRARARSRPVLHLATEESDESLHVTGAGTPDLWRARVDQLAEHLSQYAGLAPAEMASRFQILPPVGLLPRSALDVLTTDDAQLLPPSSPGMPPDRAAMSHFFPASMEVEAVPMPIEDLDAALAGSAPLAPFDFAEVDDELVRILVPVPQQLFDPRLLVVELEDPFFALEVARLVATRQDRRQRRDFQRDWWRQLQQFISGAQPPQPTAALEQGQFEPEPVETDNELPEAAYLSPADTAGPWEISAGFGAATTPIGAGSMLFVGLRHDFDNPPTRVEMRFQRGNDEFTKVWDEPSQPFVERFDSEGTPLPIPLTRWYTVIASDLGITDGTLTGFTLHLEDGRVGLTAVGQWRPPSEGEVIVGGIPNLEQWWSANDEAPVAFAGGDWTQVSGNQLTAPFETLATPVFDQGEQDLNARISEIESALNPDNAVPWKDPTDPDRVPITVAKDGLKASLSVLEAEANEADDFVDANFLRAQTNLYRIRKLILGQTAAEKLLINPAISVIAEQETATASADQLNTYLAAAKLRTVDKAAVNTALRATPQMALRARAGTKTPLMQARALAIATKVNPLVTEPSPKPSGIFSKPVIGTIGIPIESGVTPQSGVLETAAPKISTVENLGAVSLKNVFGQLPESGPVLPPRGLSIGERFTEPPATSNLSYARSALVTLVGQLPNLRLPLIDQNVRSLKGTDVSLIELQGRALPSGDSTTEKKRIDAVAALLATDEATDDTDEASVTIAALDMVEVKSAILRTIEAVIQQRRSLLSSGQDTLAAIQSSAATTQSRLEVLESSLAEARHDVNVARALRQEEQERVAGINTTRDNILRDEVKFLAYVRPRAVQMVRRNVPSWTLENGDAPAPVPACLRLHDQPPDALHAYVQLFQQAPVSWFPEITTRLPQLDTIASLTETLAATRQSALAFSAQPRIAFAQQVTHVATQNTLLTAFSRVAPLRAQAATLQIASPATLPWTDLQRYVKENSSLGDIIGGRHGKPSLAQQAAALHSQIESVATCLYAEFASVAAATRLLWVERYSQFDQPAPLRDLTVLPGYSALDRESRRRFQAFVDWLFQRVDNGIADAVNLINDLVRICLLLASHAPVNSLIAGHVPRPVPVRPGVLIPLRPFDPNQVKVGMEVHVWKASTLVAQGRVEDLGDGEVSTRIDKLSGATTTLDETMRVQFVPAALGISKTFVLQ